MVLKVLESHQNFRVRLILATLTRTPLKIERIRSNDVNPGLRDYEVSFLRLLEQITDGSIIEISYTGTTVIFRPGIIIGGDLTVSCNESRALGYYIQYLLILGPFAKKKFNIIFKGVDADEQSIGLEGVKWGFLPILEKFGVRDVEVHILKRGAAPKGGAEVHLMINQLLASPLTLHALELPKVSAIRGVAYSTRVSPNIVNRIVESVRQVVQPTNCRTDIVADAWRGDTSGKSPGWGVTLVAELKKGWRFFVERVGGAGKTPEDVGVAAAYELLEEISTSGVVCRSQIPFTLCLMLIGKENIGRVILKKLQIDETFVNLLRDVKQLLDVEVHLEDAGEVTGSGSGEYLVMVVKGMGYINANKKIA